MKFSFPYDLKLDVHLHLKLTHHIDVWFYRYCWSIICI